MPAAKPKSSPVRVVANRAHAQKSTGSRTEAGKARSRANAVKHGLTKGLERSSVFRSLPRLRGIVTNHFSSDGKRITSASNASISFAANFTPVA